jgi:hypothetical protein
MIQTKFNYLIEADKYHDKFALNKKGELGRFQLWAWNNCYRFLNFETGKSSTCAISRFIDGKVTGFTILTEEERLKIFHEKNEPPHLFEKVNPNYTKFIGDRTQYTERQIKYGLLHDNLFHLMDKETNKLWSSDFCRAMAFIISQYNFYCEVIKIYGNIAKLKDDINGSKRLINKYFISEDMSDMYSVKCNEIGLINDDPSITEEEIHKIILKAKTLPEQYKNSIFSSKMINVAKKEIDYYEKGF